MDVVAWKETLGLSWPELESPTGELMPHSLHHSNRPRVIVRAQYLSVLQVGALAVT